MIRRKSERLSVTFLLIGMMLLCATTLWGQGLSQPLPMLQTNKQVKAAAGGYLESLIQDATFAAKIEFAGSGEWDIDEMASRRTGTLDGDYLRDIGYEPAGFPVKEDYRFSRPEIPGGIAYHVAVGSDRTIWD